MSDEIKEQKLSDFFEIYNEIIYVGANLPFACFIQLPQNDRILPIVHAHIAIDEDKFKKIIQSESSTLFVQKSDRDIYFQFLNEHLVDSNYHELRRSIAENLQSGQLNRLMGEGGQVEINLKALFVDNETFQMVNDLKEMLKNLNLSLKKVSTSLTNTRPNFGAIMSKWLEFLAIAKRKFNPNDVFRAMNLAKALQEFENLLFHQISLDQDQASQECQKVFEHLKRYMNTTPYSGIESASRHLPDHNPSMVQLWQWDIEESVPTDASGSNIGNWAGGGKGHLFDSKVEKLNSAQIEEKLVHAQIRYFQTILENKEKEQKQIEMISIEKDELFNLQEKESEKLREELDMLRMQLDIARDSGATGEGGKEIPDDKIGQMQSQLKKQIEKSSKTIEFMESQLKLKSKIIEDSGELIRKITQEKDQLYQFRQSIMGKAQELLLDKNNIVQHAVMLSSQLQVEMQKSKELANQIEEERRRQKDQTQSTLQMSMKNEDLRNEMRSLKNKLDEKSSDNFENKIEKLKNQINEADKKLSLQKLEMKEGKILFAQEQNKVLKLEREIRALKVKLKLAS